jgi:hypothetical protein
MPFEAELRSLGIELPSYECDDRYYTTCPKCSHLRRLHHQKHKVLHVTIAPDKFHGGCNHCGWTFPEKGFRGESKSDSSRVGDGQFFAYGDDLRKYKNPPGQTPPYYWRQRKGGEWQRPDSGATADRLYRINEVAHAIHDGKTILVVEGEKDVDTCWRLGFPATCNASGASEPGRAAKWKEVHSEQLRGADIVVLNDNDAAGYAHAEAVCKCSHGVCKSVRRLDLAVHWPSIQNKDDISDWVARGGGTADVLRKLLVEATPAYQATPPPQQQQLPAGPLAIEDFFGYSPEHNYIYRYTGQRWPMGTIDRRLPKVGRFKASTFIDRTRSVEQMTWMPGEPELIRDRLVANGGWFDHKGATVFNLYRAPMLKPGNPRGAQRWLDHVQKIYPDNAEYLIKWCAHRCQHPHIKINHALFLGGAPGIGKDSLLEPVRYAVGEWNCETVSPTQITGRFNGYLCSVLLVISEARDLGDLARPQFYEHTKLIMASPPTALMIDEKNTKPYYIPNLVGVIITSNHKAGGIFLPADDRRHYVAWSTTGLDDFEDGYFHSLWQYFELGRDDIAAYLMQLDISEFDPKAPPPKTSAFWDIVNASRSHEASDLADALDAIAKKNGGQRPRAVTLFEIQNCTVSSEFMDWLKDRKNRRTLPDHFERYGYVPLRNESDHRDGLWVVGARRQTVYVQAALTVQEQHAAVTELQKSYDLSKGELEL